MQYPCLDLEKGLPRVPSLLSVLVGVRLGKPGGFWLFQAWQKFPSIKALRGVRHLD